MVYVPRQKASRGDRLAIGQKHFDGFESSCRGALLTADEALGILAETISGRRVGKQRPAETGQGEKEDEEFKVARHG